MEVVGSRQYVGMQAKILGFLGSGVSAEKVAAAVGCDPSYISQLLADEEFALAVSDKRLLSLGEATARDDRLNRIEDTIISRTEELIKSPIAFKSPMDAVRALTMVNGLKRRGSEGAMQTTQHSVVVQLVLPQITAQKFTVDVNNQVIKTGEQSLVTIPSGGVQALAAAHKELDKESRSIEHEQSNQYQQRSSQNRGSKGSPLKLEDFS